MGTFGLQIMTLDIACLSQNFVTPEINFGHLAPYPWGSAEAGTKVGDATQDPPDPAAPRCAPEPELTASNAYYIKKRHVQLERYVCQDGEDPVRRH